MQGHIKARTGPPDAMIFWHIPARIAQLFCDAHSDSAVYPAFMRLPNKRRPHERFFLAAIHSEVPVISGFFSKIQHTKEITEMSRKYYVWKDPACNGKDVIWTELTGKEFYALLQRPENQRRRFIRIGNEICQDADIITLEATEQQYADWRREQNAADYCARQRRNFRLVSLDAAPAASEGDYYDMVADLCMSVERTALFNLACETLRAALKTLSNEDIQLLDEVCIRGTPAAEVARMLGVHRTTIIRRIDKLLKRLQKFF